MIQLQQAILRRGSKVLLDHADLMVHSGQKVGIVGENGAGKTSLFLLLQGDLHLDDGDYSIPKQLTQAHIRQQMPTGDTPALDYALQGDRELMALQARLQQAEQADDGLLIAELHAELADAGAYGASSKAAKILLGLGFSQDELAQPVGSFSGGWRMRLNVAQVLMSRAELLLLDEPTNHLDLEAIVWLENYLQQSTQTILLISHDREFLDRVATHILYFQQRQLYFYSGNYSAFERQRAEQLAVQQATYEKQQAARAHLQSFVDRFRAKATKAKQAQSRVKMLEKMDCVAAVHESSPFQFQFKATEPGGHPMLQLRQACYQYDDRVILDHVDLSINDGDRIGLIGPNGAGKSTLIKLLVGELKLQAGEYTASQKIKMGYFAQHQLEYLQADQSAYAHMQALDRQLSEREIRRYLGGFNFQGDDVFRAVEGFSGGEKARLALALIIWQAPNLLLLDEPTNHLDLEVREALSLALQSYQGALILVSHDRHLVKSVADDLWLLADQKLRPFSGDLEDYQRWLLEGDTVKTVSKKPEKPTKGQESNVSHKELQQWKKQLASEEKRLARSQEQLKKLDERLSDAKLYENDQRDVLVDLQYQRQEIIDKIDYLEQRILELLEKLE